MNHAMGRLTKAESHHFAFSYFAREEEEDKMVEAMIKKKGKCRNPTVSFAT